MKKKQRFLFALLMAIVMMAMSPAKAWAEDVTIGDGSNGGAMQWPYCNFENNSSCVMYYTSAELRGGTISSIAFRVSNARSLATNFVKVYMADTDITSLTTALDVTSVSFTEVYSGNPTLGTASGWESLALTNSFNHNKQKNLLVAVCRSSNNYIVNLTYYVHNTGTSNNQSLYRGGSDASYADITSSTNSYTAWGNQRPDTRFTFAPCTTHQGIYHAAVAPGCTTDGTVAHWQCDVCGKYFSDENCTSELSDIVDPKLGHNLDAEKYCSRCEQTITQLDGTPFNLANYNNTIDVYSDHFVSGPVNQPYTGNLIFTGTGNQMINLHAMPADGKFALRDATITLNSSAIFSLATDNEVVIEGDVEITSNNGALYGTGTSPNLDVTGPGNLSISGGSSAAIESCFNNLNIDIEGDLKLAGDAFFSGTCNGEIKVNAKSITANCNGSRPFFYYAFKATLHAKGDILLESTSTTYDSNISYDKIWCFKGIESDEGTVLMRMGKGGGHESVGVKVGYAGIPDVSDGNSYVSAFTWKVVDKTTGTATYYGGDPRSFGGISGTSAYDVYLSLVKDSEGNTVFDMEKLYNSPINLYDGYFKNDQFNNICWEGQPVFTGTATGRRFLQFFETLSAANTPILRDLTFNTVSSCLQAPTGIDVAATIDGNVSMSCSDIAINVTNSCTITGNGSLTLNGSDYIYSCPDLNIDITGDLVGSNTGAPLYDHSFDFTKLHANSITFRIQAGSATEHAIFMPTPATTPAASDPSITYVVKGEHKDGYTIWFADYETLASCSETVVPTFASLEELIAAGQDYDAVNVTIDDEVMIAMPNPDNPSVYFVILSYGNDGYIQLKAPTPDPALNWQSGGRVTGTLTNVSWNEDDKNLFGDDASFWSALNYTEPDLENIPTYSSIADLLADENLAINTNVTVTVSGTIATAEYLSDINAYQIMLDNGFAIGAIGCVTSDPGWVVGGTISGTLQNVTFMRNSEGGEEIVAVMSTATNIFAPGAGLEYTAPAGGSECEHDFTSKTLTAEPDEHGLYAYVCDREGCGEHGDYNVVKGNGEGNNIELIATTDSETGITTYSAESVIIEDGKPFYSPVEFTTRDVDMGRQFTQSIGDAVVPATIMLPFRMYAGEVSTVNPQGVRVGTKFYSFTSLDYNSDNDRWEANMDIVIDDLEAYTPYMVVLTDGEEIPFGNAPVTFTQTPAEMNNITSSDGEWNFVATNEAKVWTAADFGHGEAYYGFAAGNETTPEGKFVKVGTGASIDPLRAYIMKNVQTRGSASNAPSRALTASQLPSTIGVRLNETYATGIGTLNTETGEFTFDGWYDLQGRRISEPVKNGISVKNDKKILVK